MVHISVSIKVNGRTSQLWFTKKCDIWFSMDFNNEPFTIYFMINETTHRVYLLQINKHINVLLAELVKVFFGILGSMEGSFVATFFVIKHPNSKFPK